MALPILDTRRQIRSPETDGNLRIAKQITGNLLPRVESLRAKPEGIERLILVMCTAQANDRSSAFVSLNETAQPWDTSYVKFVAKYETSVA